LGIEVTFVDDPDDLDAWRAAIRPTTKAVFAESLGNPRGNVLDIRGVADVAHEAGVPLVVDNTVPTPYLLRPAEHGADIVVHSATKFLGGHGTTLGGVVVDAGSFDFGAHPERFPGFTEPDPS
ncbi:O-acetylhomoserine aminocarboxypropyltransferase, partial [Streptomyces sp. NRRL F-6602]